MYKIKKRLEISGSHQLCLNYESKCQNVHGHNWVVDIHLQAKELNENGMVMDFTEIKKKIHDQLDHKHLNDVLDFNPTAENIAKWICDQLQPYCYRVVIQESSGNTASYERG